VPLTDGRGRPNATNHQPVLSGQLAGPHAATLHPFDGRPGGRNTERGLKCRPARFFFLAALQLFQIALVAVLFDCCDGFLFACGVFTAQPRRHCGDGPRTDPLGFLAVIGFLGWAVAPLGDVGHAPGAQPMPASASQPPRMRAPAKGCYFGKKGSTTH